MSKFQLVFDGEEPEDELFDSYEEAEEHAIYLQSCQRQGAEILHWSNPGDNPYDEETFEAQDYTITQVSE